MESLGAHLPTDLSTGNQLSQACAFENQKQDVAAICILASTH